MPIIRAANNGELEDFLLIFNYTSFYKTPALFKQMRENQVILVLVPPGCTPLVQPYNIYINIGFKSMVKEEANMYEHPRGPNAE